MPTAVSFFAGAGGLDIGIERAGFDIRLTVEIEEVYCRTLRLNRPFANVRQGDIMEYNRGKVYKEAGMGQEEEIDLMIGGSPCQSFSTAGKRQAFADPRGQAMLKYAELVNAVKPKFFLLENVKGLLSAALRHRPLNMRGEGFPPLEPEEQSGSALQFLLNKFGDQYNVVIQLVNSADYGVPQKRERVFLVGVRKDIGLEYQFPEATHNAQGNDGLQPWVTAGDLLNSLKFTQHHYTKYSAERLKYMKMIPQGGGNWRDLPPELIPIAMAGAYNSGGGKVGFFRRVHLDRPFPTLLTSPAQKSTNLGHPYEDRPLSIEEYLAVQEFPSDYTVAGTLNQQYTQIGNAVPIRLAQSIGESIYTALVHRLQYV